MALRSTFRNPAGDVAWQRQSRDRHSAEGTPPVPHLDVKRAVVRPVGRRLAEQIVLKYEWLGTMSRTRWHYGIFFGTYCAGVCCVATAVGTGGINTPRLFGLTHREMGILARGACTHWAPTGSNSKLVAWTGRLVAADAGLRLLAAYADTDAGEIGTIYQACGWIYIGQGQSTTQFIAPNGRIYDQKIVYDLRHNAGRLRSVAWTAQRDALRSAGWREQASNPKHRYVCVLDKSDADLVARVESMRRPYPKRPRAASIDADAPGTQPGEDGSLPIAALHREAG